MFLKQRSNFQVSSLTVTLQHEIYVDSLQSEVKLTWALFMHVLWKMEVLTLRELLASELDSYAERFACSYAQ